MHRDLSSLNRSPHPVFFVIISLERGRAIFSSSSPFLVHMLRKYFIVLGLLSSGKSHMLTLPQQSYLQLVDSFPNRIFGVPPQLRILCGYVSLEYNKIALLFLHFVLIFLL